MIVGRAILTGRAGGIELVQQLGIAIEEGVPEQLHLTAGNIDVAERSIVDGGVQGGRKEVDLLVAQTNDRGLDPALQIGLGLDRRVEEPAAFEGVCTDKDLDVLVVSSGFEKLGAGAGM